MDLKRVLEKGIHNLNETYKHKSKIESNCILRGSNTPFYIDNQFIASESDHCPRKAIFRSKYGIIDSKTENEIISHKAGRVVEEVIKEVINESKENNLSYLQEEEAQIEVKYDNKTIFTARPDIVFQHFNKKYVLEMKSIQSTNTFIQVSIEKEVKCGAALQTAVYHNFLNIQHGYIAYILYYYLDGYNFKTKSRIKEKPTIIVFNTELRKDGILYIDNKKTLITKSSIENGIEILYSYLIHDLIPPRPVFKTIYDKSAKYSPCNYCHLRETCDLIDNRKLHKFKDIPGKIINT